MNKTTITSNNQLMEGFRITQIMECIAEADKIRVIAMVSNPIEKVFPYLNAINKRITYNHNAEIVILKKDRKLITIYSEMITIAKVNDEDDAKNILRWIQIMINETWKRRNEIVPSYEVQQLLSPVDIYGLLPKTNCKLCGENTCYAFTCALLAGTRNVEQCGVLSEPEYADAKDRLWSALIADDIVQI